MLALLSMVDVREYTIHGVGGGAECARLLLDAGAEVGLRTGRVSGACAMGAGSSTDEGECSEDDAGECSSNSDRPAHLTALHLAKSKIATPFLSPNPFLASLLKEAF